MRLAIVSLTAGGLSGGYLKYFRAIVPRLVVHPDVESLEIYFPAPARALVGDYDWPSRFWPVEDAWRGFPHLRLAVREARPDVIFIPTASWLAFGATPVVTMVRNMEPLEVPFGGNPLREAVRNLARRMMARRACQRAARVIAVSNHVRQFLISRWGIAAGKTSVIYHGVDAPDAASLRTRPSNLGSTPRGEFLFAAGSIRPARGLEDLIAALPHVRAAGIRTKAVIAGRPDAGMLRYQRRLASRARQLGVGDDIMWTGSLGEPEMRWCYENCAALVMTTRAEACPNIALEAMSHGCVCVSVDRPPMPEFFAGAAAYYRAGDAGALARAVTTLWRSDVRSALGSAASARARAFDWQTTADRTVAELRAAVRS